VEINLSPQSQVLHKFPQILYDDNLLNQKKRASKEFIKTKVGKVGKISLVRDKLSIF
jgi:hypothetical protein